MKLWRERAAPVTVNTSLGLRRHTAMSSEIPLAPRGALVAPLLLDESAVVPQFIHLDPMPFNPLSTSEEGHISLIRVDVFQLAFAVMKRAQKPTLGVQPCQAALDEGDCRLNGGTGLKSERS
jgi:hypothetical protein